MKVFLSYASEDREAARTLAKGLRESGHDVYPGSQWPEDVRAALKRAEAFVVLLSPSAVGSPYVNQEIKHALVSERLENRVIPVILQASTQIPWILQTMHPIAATATPTTAAKAVNERLQQSADTAAR
jgi:hypothetical protein